MTSIRMAMSELRRLTAGRLPKLAVVALLCVPMLYGGLYLYANHDPYGRLDKVPTAVVVTERDHTVPVSRQRKLADAIAGARVYSAPGGHASVFLDAKRWVPVFAEAVADVTAACRADDELAV